MAVLIKDGFIADIKNINDESFLFKLCFDDIGKEIRPGQFLNVRIDNEDGVILRRPFSILRHYENKYIEFVFKVVGKGTKRLSKMKKGEKINVIFPLGNGFELEELKSCLFLAGGIGIASLYSLIESMNFLNSLLIYGARTFNSFILLDDIKKIKIEKLFCTDDGSYGTKGTVIEAAEKVLQKNKYERIYACGPHAMLKEVAKLSKNYSIKAFVAMETILGCGLGLCLGCALKSADSSKYLYLCKDGPIFNVNFLEW